MLVENRVVAPPSIAPMQTPAAPFPLPRPAPSPIPCYSPFKPAYLFELRVDLAVALDTP